MKWWKSKKPKQDKSEEPVDILEVFTFIQKALIRLKEIQREVKTNPMDISQLRRENELLKMRISRYCWM